MKNPQKKKQNDLEDFLVESWLISGFLTIFFSFVLLNYSRCIIWSGPRIKWLHFGFSTCRKIFFANVKINSFFVDYYFSITILALFICFFLAILNVFIRKNYFGEYFNSKYYYQNKTFHLPLAFLGLEISFLLIFSVIENQILILGFYLTSIFVLAFFFPRPHPAFGIFWKSVYMHTYIILFEARTIPLVNAKLCLRLSFHVLIAAILNTTWGNYLIRFPILFSGVLTFFYFLLDPCGFNYTMCLHLVLVLFLIWNAAVMKALLHKESWYHRFYFTAYPSDDIYKLLGLMDFEKPSSDIKTKSTTYKGRKKDQNE